MKKLLPTLLTLGILTTSSIYADSNIEVSISPDGDNNPLTFTFEITNSSDEPIKIFKSSIPFDGEIGSNLFDVRDNHNPLRYLGRVVERTHEVNEKNYLYLDSQDSYRTTVNLSTLYNFSRENRTYNISFSSPIYVAYEDGEKESISLHSNSLDIEASVNQRTIRKRQESYESSCSQNQQQQLNEALKYAENLAVNSSNILHTSDANNTQFKEWFGSGNYATVTEHFDKITSVLSTNSVNFNCGCTMDYLAYVNVYSPYTIHLCSGYWNLDVTGADSKSGTIIHETSHFNIVAGTRDHAYGIRNSRDLAQSSPATAVANADSHEYFAERNREAMITAPNELNVTDITSSTAQLIWQDNSNNEIGFEIFNGNQKVGDVDADSTSFDITGLSAGHSYEYLVRAKGEHNTISTTAGIKFVTHGSTHGIPLAPTVPLVLNIQRDEALLHWDDNADNESGFRLYRGEELVATVGANIEHYQLRGLTPSTAYTYNIKAYNAEGESSAIEFSFQSAEPLTQTTHAINLGDRVNGRWNQNSPSTHRDGQYAEFYTFTLEHDTNIVIDLESGYSDTYLYLLRGERRDGVVINEDDDGGSATNAQISKRLSAGTYTIEATTYDNSVGGSFTLVLGGTNATVGHAPIKPSYIMPTSINEHSIALHWSSVDKVDGFKIYKDGVEIATVETNTTSYNVTNLNSDTEYNFGVKAFNQYGQSDIKTLSIRTAQAPVVVNTGENSISMNSSKSGEWVSSIASTHRDGRYAQYYTFKLSEATMVTIDLESTTDAYLLLLEGEGKNGRKIAYNDDGGEGRNSKIVKYLQAGSYTIEATTFASAQTGSFEVKLGHTDTPSVTTKSISLNQTKSGQWSSATLSTHRTGRYAQYYTFTLSQRTRVTIDLESAIDAYLFLLNQEGVSGSVISQNDDGGEGRNSRITRELNAGTYTIEATTYNSSATDEFNLRLNN